MTAAHPTSRRRRARWSVSVALAAILLPALASIRSQLWWSSGRGHGIGLLHGTLWFEWWATTSPPTPIPPNFAQWRGFNAQWRPAGWYWKGAYHDGLASTVTKTPTRILTLPLWPLLITLGAATWWTWRPAWMHQPNTCPRCFYDRSGLASGVPCPECGVNPG